MMKNIQSGYHRTIWITNILLLLVIYNSSNNFYITIDFLPKFSLFFLIAFLKKTRNMSKLLKNIFKINLSLQFVNYLTINAAQFYELFLSIFIFFPGNENLNKVASNLNNYVKYQSWKYCNRCHIVEPKKMLPNYGKQKMTHLNNCICTKGRYFVPMV